MIKRNGKMWGKIRKLKQSLTILLQDYYRVNAFSSKFNAVGVCVCAACKADGADTGDVQNDYMLYHLYV